MHKVSFYSVLVVVLLVLNSVFIFLNPFSEPVQAGIGLLLTLLFSILAVLGTAYSLSSLKRFDHAKKAWLLMFIGIALFSIAEALYAYLEIILKLDVESISPSIADIFYISAYIPIFIGIAIFVATYLKSGLPLGNAKKVFIFFDLFVGILAVFLVVFGIAPHFYDAEISLAAKLVSLYYPIADLAILVLLLRMIYLTFLYRKGKYAGPWLLIGFGFLAFTISDSVYSLASNYISGSWTDLGWNLAYLLFAGSAIKIHSAEQVNFLGRQEGQLSLSDQIIEIMAPSLGREMAENCVVQQCKNMKISADTMSEKKISEFALKMSTAISIIIGTEKAGEIQDQINALGK